MHNLSRLEGTTLYKHVAIRPVLDTLRDLAYGCAVANEKGARGSAAAGAGGEGVFAHCVVFGRKLVGEDYVLVSYVLVAIN